MQWDDDDYAPRAIAQQRRTKISYGGRGGTSAVPALAHQQQWPLAALATNQCRALQAAFANDNVLRHQRRPPQQPTSTTVLRQQKPQRRASISYRRAQPNNSAIIEDTTTLQHGGGSMTQSAESATSRDATSLDQQQQWQQCQQSINATEAARSCCRRHCRWSASSQQSNAEARRLANSILVPRPAQQSGMPVEQTSVGLADTIGRRPSMEDEIVVARHIAPNGTHFCLFVVCDGHGGDRVSRFVAKRWPELLFGFLDGSSGGGTQSCDDAKLTYALRESIAACNDLVHADLLRAPQARLDIGTTLCALLLVDNCRLFSVNVGDSRALAVTTNGLLWRAKPLTVDHRPGRIDERQRIEMLGGFVMNHDGVDRVMGNLAVSRALGDFHLVPYVCAEPTIDGPVLLEPHIGALVLCCDGVTDVLTDEDIAAVVATGCAHSGAESAAKALRNAAFERGSGDNISVLVIDLTTG